jgi:GT2 family glycosyltransferase
MNIYYSNPYSTSKNFGKAINDFCRLVPNDNDWIVIQDGDIIYLTSDWGNRIEKALEMEGDKFGLVSCYTNKLRNTNQLHRGKFNFSNNLEEHYEIAITYDQTGIIDIGKLNVAGFFMAFKKSTWIACKGFDENTRVFDTIFNNKVRALGMKVGLIRSLYVYHAYRIWSKSSQPWNDYKHLK